jgi:ribosomal protein L25 (general stress protein Ctc)
MIRKRDLPKNLIEKFWSRVRRLVKDQCGLTSTAARAETDGYRRSVESKVGDMIYHENAEDVALTIAHGVWWSQVRELLIHEHEMTPSVADRAVTVFLKFADEKKFKESIFDRDAKSVATIIARGVKYGFEAFA